MAGIDDLRAVVSQGATADAALAAAITLALADLKAQADALRMQVASGVAAADLAPQIAQLTSSVSAVQAATAQLQAADPGAPPAPAGGTTPPAPPAGGTPGGPTPPVASQPLR